MPSIHATTIAIDGCAIALTGPSGAGKSDLALRLFDLGAVLIADDLTNVELRGNTLFAKAPAEGAGVMEVRGIGLLPFSYIDEAPLGLFATLSAPDLVERLPEPDLRWEQGVSVTRIRLSPFEPSAPQKVILALKCATGQLRPVTYLADT